MSKIGTALGEALKEFGEIGVEHPVLKEILTEDFLGPTLRWIGLCAETKTPFEQVVISAIAVGITIGRKVPMETN